MAATSTARGPRPRLSVVIPMYNEQGYIGPCLESLRSQAFPLQEMEILVVDGCSTDRSAEIVASMVPAFPSLRLLRNTVRWTPESLNLGLRAATAETVIRLDSHCRYSADWIRRSVELLDETGAMCTGGRLEAAPGGPGLVARSICVAQQSVFGTGGARWRTGGKAGFVDSVPFGCFRRRLFDEIGLFDKRFPRNQDTEMFGRIRAFGHRIYFDPSITATYYTRATLGGYLRMMWQNGLYLPPVWRVNPASFRPRHLMPALFFLGLVAGLVSIFVFTPLAILAAAGFALYMLADLTVSLRLAAQDGPAMLLTMPWLFLLTHLVYGLGTVVGVFRLALRPLPDNPEVRRPPRRGAPEP